MYATEYDLIVAEDRLRGRRDEMKAIRMARAARPETPARPSRLDRLLALAGCGEHIQAPHRKVGAAA
jgi:hypothetical protein